MGFNKVSLITLMLLLFLTVSAVNASAVQLDNDALVLDESGDDSISVLDGLDDDALIDESDNDLIQQDSSNILTANQGSVYVDPINGDDENDGYSMSSSVKTLNKAISLAGDNNSIHLSSGVYSGLDNTRLNITKSLHFIGYDDAVIDGENANYLFIIQDSLTVSFSNIKFINAYKSPRSYSINYNENVYGAALEIKNATVIIDSCVFLNSRLYYDTSDKYVYGAAISNFGDLTITDSYFENNSALSDTGLFSYGGCVYNKGKLLMNRTVLNKSSAIDFGFGAGIANDGDAIVDFSLIVSSTASQECRGSAIYNNGNLRLSNSRIENNTIRRANFNFIFGAIYNNGDLTAYGNVFANNSADYDDPISSFKGSPTIYNVGNLNLSYNAFIDNMGYDGVASDLYFNGGELITADYNWWNTNDNPFESYRVNIDEVKAWLTFNILPDYSKLDIGDAVEISAFFSSSTGVLHNIDLLPVFNVSFNIDGITKEMVNGNASFIFTRSEEKGSFEIIASICSFNQSAIVDIGKLDTEISIQVPSNITYLDDLDINIEVIGVDSGIPEGNVSVMIADNVYVLELRDGKANLTLSNLLPGESILKVLYGGNDDYFKSFGNATVTIEKQSIDLTLEIPEIRIDQKANAIVGILTEGAYGQGLVYVDGVRKKIVYLYNGETTIQLNNFDEGDYNITVEFLETQYYKAVNASAILKVRKYDSSFNISAEDIFYGETAKIIIIPDPSSLIGQAKLIINGYSTAINIDNPRTVVSLEGLAGGSYDVQLVFEGDSRYYPSNASCSFNVLKYSSGLNVVVDYDEDTLNGTISVKTSPGNCTGVVGVYINYNEYRMELKDGQALFNVRYDKGTNYIFVYYEGDDYHEESTWNTTIGVADDFVLMGKNVTAYQFNDFYYSIRLLEPSGVPLPMRTVTISFNGTSYNVTTDENGFGDFKLNLDSGIYEISATYKNSTVTHSLVIKDIEFSLNANNISYGDVEELKVIFEDEISGKINFVIDGILDVDVDILNRTALYNISGLNAGNYTIKAIYRNDYFSSAESLRNFTIAKAYLSYDVMINDITPEINPIIRLINLANATGEMAFIFNGITYNELISESQAVLTLMETFAVGNYTVKVSYSGDINYNGFEDSIVFYVKDEFSSIILELSDGVYGEILTATARLNSNATGYVNFTANDLSELIEVQDGIAVWKFTGLDVGTYNLTAKYLGDNHYLSSSNSSLLTVSKANSTIVLYSNEVYLNENIRIYANLSANATGYVTFSILGYYTPRDKIIVDSQAMWYISPLNTGSYTVIASYNGDSNYFGSNSTYILTISQRQAFLTVDIEDIGLNQDAIAKVSLKTRHDEEINGTVILTIGEEIYYINVLNGQSSYNLGRLDEGNYSFSAIYEGNDVFGKASSNGSFIVSDEIFIVNLTANDLEKYYGGAERLVVSTSLINKVLSGAKINVLINNKKYQVLTDDEGKAVFDLNILPGKYVATISLESSKYHASPIKVNIIVKNTIEAFDVVKLYGSATQYYAIFCDDAGNLLANADVKVSVGSKTYTVKTMSNGIASLNLNLKVGNYIVTAMNPVTGEKLSSKLFVYNYLMENKDLSNFCNYKQIYKVRAYKNGGKVASNVVVQIKVNSKVYKVKTDKKGYAKLALNLKPGTYAIKATYNKFAVSNRLTVKHILKAKNVKVKKSAKRIKIKVSLKKVNGKYLKNKKIILKFNKKTFKVKTNKKGIASFTIKKKFYKSLMVGKKYSYKVVYGKDTIKKVIRFRK